MEPSVILLVEDHPTTRKLVKGALEHAGFTVREAKDSQSALALMSAERPRLVIQDLQLPDIDAFLLSSELRALAKDDIRVFALSGLLSSADARRLEASGFDDVIEKPVDPGRLLARVREQFALERRVARPMIAVEQPSARRTRRWTKRSRR